MSASRVEARSRPLPSPFFRVHPFCHAVYTLNKSDQHISRVSVGGKTTRRIRREWVNLVRSPSGITSYLLEAGCRARSYMNADRPSIAKDEIRERNTRTTSRWGSCSCWLGFFFFFFKKFAILNRFLDSTLPLSDFSGKALKHGAWWKIRPVYLFQTILHWLVRF